MELSVEGIEILLFVAALVALVTRRLRIPYTVGLVLAGIVLALSSMVPNISLTKDLIFTIFLPPLVYEATLYIHWRELRRDLPIIVALATLGVLLSAAITASGMHYLVGWEWQSAILFGVLIAATDPVSVIAAFKEARVHGRLRLLVEAESLFNDSTAAVGFAIALAYATGEHVDGFGTLLTLTTTVVGGIVCGLIITGGVLLLAWQTKDHLVEITLTTIAAYGSFLLAEHFHFSGVLACLTAGLLTGNLGTFGSISPRGREALQAFWEFAAFAVNSLIFMLIGIRTAQQDFAGVWIAILVAIALVILGRAFAIYPVCFLFERTALRVESGHQHVLFWGGLRGALALALALGLPANVPRSDQIVSVSFAVVAFSVFVQGLTMTPLLRRAGHVPQESPA
jgi:monovalent cation:H+ antiporter, CPA1 family